MRGLLVALAAVAALLALVQLLVPPLADGPIRRWAERTANARLRGYRVDVGSVRVSPLALGARLRDVAFVEEGADATLARVPVVDGGLDVRKLLAGRLALASTVSDPEVAVDAARLRRAVALDLPAQLEDGTRELLATIRAYGAELGRVTLDGGRVAYTSRGATAGLHALRGTIEGDDPLRVDLTGRPLGTGTLEAHVVVTPATRPDVALRAAVRDVDLVALNGVLRAHEVGELASGRFAFFTEATVRDGVIAGWAKPFFEAVRPVEHETASLPRRLAEDALGGVTGLLENERDEIATRTTLSGTLDGPDAGVLEAIGGVLRNAFVESIRPGFEAALAGG